MRKREGNRKVSSVSVVECFRCVLKIAWRSNRSLHRYTGNSAEKAADWSSELAVYRLHYSWKTG